MNLPADMGRHSGRATPSLHDAPYRQFEETTGRRSTYPLPITVQANQATSIDRFGHQTFTFGNALKFLDAAPRLDLGCVFLDYCMPGIDGLAVQKCLTEMNCLHPVVLLTGIGEIPEAVATMRAGAIDFLRKPFRHAALSEALDRTERRLAELDRFAALNSLTDREREVLIAVASGGQSKIVAHELGISPRTIEVHRSAVLRKLGVLNMGAALLLAQQAGLLAN